MELKGFEESAWTPELGGDFTGVKLKIKAYLPAEQRKYGRSLIKFEVDRKTRRTYPVQNGEKYLGEFDERILGLILDWDGVTDGTEALPCTDENKAMLLNYADRKTGIELEFDVIRDDGEDTDEKETRPARLFEYIERFAADIENFEKN